MRFLRKHPRLRPLDERECYLRLHGRRSGEVEVIRTPVPVSTSASALVAGELVAGERLFVPVAERPAGPSGPTDDAPALHLVIAYPRSGARLTGEQVRRELLRRMQARAGEAA